MVISLSACVIRRVCPSLKPATITIVSSRLATHNYGYSIEPFYSATAKSCMLDFHINFSSASKIYEHVA